MQALKKLSRRLRYLYRLYILKDEFKAEVARWTADRGEQTLRLNYPSLNSDSVVFDVGGYVGDFAEEIHKKYGCQVYLFEPHPDFFEQCVRRFAGNPKITPLNYGLSDESGTFALSDSTDGSSFLNPKHESRQGIECEVKEVFSVLAELGISHIDLMKINIEGGEFPLLKHISENQKLTLITNFQIQFHNFIDGAEAKRDELIAELSKSHTRTWCYEFVWENWTRT